MPNQSREMFKYYETRGPHNPEQTKEGCLNSVLSPLTAFPITKEFLFRKYIHVKNFDRRLEGLSRLIPLLRKKELRDYTADEIDDLYYTVEKETAREWIAICEAAKEEYHTPAFENLNFFHSSNKRKSQNDALTETEYIQLFWLSYNNDSISKNNLVRKALESYEAASIWFIMSCHLFLAWRREDFLLFPDMPSCRYTAQELRKKIGDGNFTTEDAEEFVIYNETRYRYGYFPPHKTRSSNPPALQYRVYEPVREIHGLLLAILQMHHMEHLENPFVVQLKKITAPQIVKIFGQSYVDAVGWRAFPSRPLNKALMQLISTTVELADPKGKKIMLQIAAAARSHKGGMKSCTESTLHYLDYKSDGESFDTVSKNMCERGAFSFVKWKVLDEISEDFGVLDMEKQTKAITALDADAYDLEAQSKFVMAVTARIEGDTVLVGSILAKGGMEKLLEHFDAVVDGMHTGMAVGKEPFTYCARMACKRECVHPESSSCVGCGQEYYLKQYLATLGEKIYLARIHMEEAKEIKLQQMYQYRLQKLLIPTAIAIIKAVEHNGQPTKAYRKIIQYALERGTENAGAEENPS